MPLFPTYDINSNSIILTIFNPHTLSFIDPITNINYDYPFVFENELDMQINLPTLLSSLIQQQYIQLQNIHLNITNMSSLLIQLQYPNNPIYFLHNHNSNNNIPFIYINNIPINPLNSRPIQQNNSIHKIPHNTTTAITTNIKPFNKFTFKPSNL